MREENFLKTVLSIHSSKVVTVEPKSVEGEHFLADALILLALKFADGIKIKVYFIFLTIYFLAYINFYFSIWNDFLLLKHFSDSEG